MGVARESQLWYFLVLASMKGGSYKLKKNHPALDVGFAFAYFADMFETLRKNTVIK